MIRYRGKWCVARGLAHEACATARRCVGDKYCTSAVGCVRVLGSKRYAARCTLCIGGEAVSDKLYVHTSIYIYLYQLAIRGHHARDGEGGVYDIHTAEGLCYPRRWWSWICAQGDFRYPYGGNRWEEACSVVSKQRGVAEAVTHSCTHGGRCMLSMQVVMCDM